MTVPWPGPGAAPRRQDGGVIEITADESGAPRNGAVRAA